MKAIQLVFTTLGILCLLGCATVKKESANQESTRFEYALKAIRGEEATEYTINTMAERGWTLVSATPRNSEGGMYVYILVFKKTKQDGN
jgi:uncharacterized protein YceK